MIRKSIRRWGKQPAAWGPWAAPPGPSGRGRHRAGAGSGQHVLRARMVHHTGQPLPWRHWLKWLVTVDVDRQLLLSQTARRVPWNDCANLPMLVEAANE